MPLIFRKQPSGGRGEYELVGESGGTSAMDLMNHEFVWATPFGRKHTMITLTGQGQKRRLRIQPGADVPHVQRQAAALAMLPRSIRDEARVSRGRPIVLENGYILDIELSLLEVDGGAAVVRPSAFTARSGPYRDIHHRIDMHAESRLIRLQEVWEGLEALPGTIRVPVEQHQEHLVNGLTIDSGAENAVRNVIASLSEFETPRYIPGADPLPALELLLGISSDIELPAPDEAPIGAPDIRMRIESEYRLVRSRGASHDQFKKAVQKAYNFRCAFCGMRALDIPGRARAGLDAAHILPWGQYDLDVVQNGMLLCKRDHWAFDSHVLLLRHENGQYRVEINPRYAATITDEDTLEVLGQATGAIPVGRLPVLVHERPSPSYIEALYEGLEE